MGITTGNDPVWSAAGELIGECARTRYRKSVASAGETLA